MNPGTVVYQPKGGMCMTCRHAKRDCSDLPFLAMPVIFKFSDNSRIVRCTEHVKAPDLRLLALDEANTCLEQITQDRIAREKRLGLAGSSNACP